jgi:hypothetical protein
MTIKPLVRLHLRLVIVAFLVGFGGAMIKLATQTPRAVAIVSVLVADLPAFHVITLADLTDEPIAPGELADHAYLQQGALVNAIALVPLDKGKPIKATSVLAAPDPALIADALFIPLQVAPTLTFDGRLKSGDLVSAWSNGTRLAERMLILDVTRHDSVSFVFVACPTTKCQAIIDANKNQTLIFTPTM